MNGQIPGNVALRTAAFRNAILIPGLVLALGACTAPGQFSSSTVVSSSCPKGTTKVHVKYGDSYLDVNPQAKTKANAALQFVLDPKSTRGPNGLNYDDVTVTIKGKNADASWISESGKASEGRDLIVCVPPAQAEGTYFYLVEVEQVGTLDPRADVTK